MNNFIFQRHDHWLDGPNHVLEQLKLFRKLPKSLQKLVEPWVKRGSWHAHSYNILTHLLARGDEEDREFAIEKTLSLRTGDKETGDKTLCVRYGKETQRNLNMAATSLHNLINWGHATVKESPLTVELSKVVTKTFYFKMRFKFNRISKSRNTLKWRNESKSSHSQHCHKR